MRWITRLAVFVLSASVGASSWYILAQRKTEPVQTSRNVEETPALQTNISEAQQDAPDQAIKFVPAGPMMGYLNAASVILRESPEASAPIVAKLTIDDYASAEILGATRDFLHVRLVARNDSGGDEERKRDYEGWTDWGSVTPSTSAIVLDAETGAVISRMPIGHGFASVAYSPDGERITFYGAQDDSIAGYEVRTSDYTPVRSFVSTTSHANGSIFYSPSDGSLSAAILSRGQDYAAMPTMLSIVSVGDEGSSNIRTEISVEAEDFAVAPDGFTGFILHRIDKQRHEMTTGVGMTVDVEMKVDVVDLRTFKIRNSFTLQGTALPLAASAFVVNHDGTELYARLDERNSVSVIDTRTGQLVRLLPFDSEAKDYWYFDQGDLIGDSLLLKVWNQDEDEMHTPPHAVWLGSGGRIATEKGISCAVQAGDARYAVNEMGTRLLKLDSNNHIRARFPIERPDLQKGTNAEDGLSIFSLSASPDGKRLILIVGIEDGC